MSIRIVSIDMQANADSTGIDVHDATDAGVEAAAAEAKPTDKTASSPRLTSQTASGAAQNVDDPAVKRDSAMVEPPIMCSIPHFAGPLNLSAYSSGAAPLPASSITSVRRAPYWQGRGDADDCAVVCCSGWRCWAGVCAGWVTVFPGGEHCG